jgi:rare lipoprotein A (peptidoglycan hydrolase)
MLVEGREIVVPIVDRGPLAAGCDWDLTQTTADALGFTGVGHGRLRAAGPGRSRMSRSSHPPGWG